MSFSLWRLALNSTTLTARFDRRQGCVVASLKLEILSLILMRTNFMDGYPIF